MEGGGGDIIDLLTQRIRHHEVPDGHHGICVGVYQEGGLDVLDRP